MPHEYMMSRQEVYNICPTEKAFAPSVYRKEYIGIMRDFNKILDMRTYVQTFCGLCNGEGKMGTEATIHIMCTKLCNPTWLCHDDNTVNPPSTPFPSINSWQGQTKRYKLNFSQKRCGTIQGRRLSQPDQITHHGIRHPNWQTGTGGYGGI